MPITFVGVALAEHLRRERISIAVTRGTASRTYLIARAEGFTSLQRAADFIVRHATANTVVAIDAPLILRNHVGQRPCEIEIDRRFGRFGVASRTANLSLYPDPAGVRFVDLLRWDGFRHDPRYEEPRMRAGRWLFEVRAHPAQVILFGLDNSSARPTTPVAGRRLGLRRLQEHLRSLQYGAPRLEMTPALDELVGRDVGRLRGRRQIAHYQESLDALVCAYVAAYCWRWGRERNERIGDLESGYVIVPTVAHTPQVNGESIAGDGWTGIDNGVNGDE